jgi:uncharacterized protein (TIGR02594 family)
MAATFRSVRPGDPAWLVDAFSHLGLAEIPGGKHNETIVGIFAANGHPHVSDDETSWCAAFANWIMDRAGHPMTGKLTARSFTDYGKPAVPPKRGDIVVIKRGNSTWQGHVFFWLAEEGEYIWGIGGNQGKIGAVSVARFSKGKLLAIRRPWAVAKDEAKPPVPAKRKTPPAAVYAEALVKAIQQALLDKGYPQVGQVDGAYGDKTRKAIIAFQDDHDLPMTGEPTGDLLAAILGAEVKAQPEARAEATPAEVREVVPEVRATFFSKVWGLIAGTGAMIAAGFNWLAGNFAEVREQVQPILDAFGDIPIWLYLAVFGGFAFWLWQQSRKGEAKGVEAFKSGERR